MGALLPPSLLYGDRHVAHVYNVIDAVEALTAHIGAGEESYRGRPENDDKRVKGDFTRKKIFPSS